ncbi:Trp repressor [Desulfamplus magnetovallimortis]|uniref:Trp repressor n=2 Tax=Desulfamplus magnetovallimortis TaxID=1246637 RepID=A0A1W1HFE9_9BACT|nr:Trp repressor [Desulfamplus magnetovallimortis]
MTMDRDLLENISSINDLDELASFFDEIMTPGEVADLSLRWKLLIDLQSGMTQRKIAEKYGISLCKITRGSKILKKRDSVVKKILTRKSMDDP